MRNYHNSQDVMACETAYSCPAKLVLIANNLLLPADVEFPIFRSVDHYLDALIYNQTCRETHISRDL